MKKKSRTQSGRSDVSSRVWWRRCLVSASLLACAASVRAAETNAPAVTPVVTPEQMFEGGAKTYNNWVEFSAGGLIMSGDHAPAQQRDRLSGGAFGGIEDLHYQADIKKGTTISLDGHGIYDEHNYQLSLGVQREEFGFLRFGFENFRTYDAGLGGTFAPDNLHYQLGPDALALDRGQVFFEAGLFKKDLPKLNFKYTHRYRDGEKSSTSWGAVPTTYGTRGLYPGFYDLDEKADIFQFDASYLVKKIKTELGLGVRYETGTLNNSKNLSFFNDPSNPYRVTDSQNTTYDALNVHATTETWLKKNLLLSTGFMYDRLETDFSGSRIYGDDFDVAYTPGFPLGYLNLNGGAHKNEYVANVNLMTTQLKNFTIVPSLRVQKDDWNSDSSGTGTRGSDTGDFVGSANRELIEVRERLDARYLGFTNWVVYGGGEWLQGQGSLTENGGLSQLNSIGMPPIDRQTDDQRNFQKYSLGARWYPVKRASVDAGVYYKQNEYTYDNSVDSTPNNDIPGNVYPAFLVLQDMETYDGNLRLTLRPVKNVTLVGRYEYQISTIHTAPDALSGLSETESSKLNRNIFGLNGGWTPLRWLSLQTGFNYVTSETKTPASDYTQAVLNSLNNYWTVNFNAGFVLDDKTDLNLGFFHYRANDFQANYADGLPLGADGNENSVTATLTRRLTPQLRLNLKYAYSHNTDAPSQGAFDYSAHVVYTSLQYRF